jgi:hypothetical protein
MDTQIESSMQWFRQIYLEGIPLLLSQQETAFLSFVCTVTAIDALAAYRYTNEKGRERFSNFIADYFPPEYKPHAANLYTFRCRLLHNFSPAYFSLVHANPEKHLQPSTIGDYYLDDFTFFNHLHLAADVYFEELVCSQSLQQDALARLENRQNGGTIYVTPAS